MTITERKIIENDLIACGKRVRVSALIQPDLKTVHVIFKVIDGWVGAFMKKETYRAIPYDRVATWEEYANFGVLTPAPGDFFDERN